MNSELFREKVQAYRRPSGHSQQELAEALGIQRQVLARKLSAKNPAHFTHPEVKQIIKTLAEWDAISSQEEAFELLALLDMRPVTFSQTEWDTWPLSKLEKVKAATQPSQISSLMTPPPTALHQPQSLHNLPVQLTELVGRKWLVELAIERLTQSQGRLLTLVGAGGIGKTRLSIEIGRRLYEQFEQGVFFVDLASLHDPAQFSFALIQVFGLIPAKADENIALLKEFLTARQILLILDNFEQILPAATILSQLLIAAPSLKIIVTSRAALQIYGESELGVPPLELPDLANLPSLDKFRELAKFAAIQLFIIRAQAVLPTFQLNQTNFSEVAQLCILLEGLPLSIELAAARVKIMPLPFLLQRLSASKLETLSKGSRNLPTRQQTLRATLDWSYALLSSEACQLFNRLGVFIGNFNLTAVEQICFGFTDDQAAPSDLLESLSALVDQSLLKPLEGIKGELRFSMLETMREYALQKLSAAGELTIIQTRYRLYYKYLAEKLTVDFYVDPEDKAGLTELLEQDFDNFLVAQYLVEPEQPNLTKAELKPIQVEDSILIERPLPEVFEYISRAENWPEWNSLIKECQPLEPSPVQVGKLYQCVSSILGRLQEQTIMISAFIPNQLLEIQTKAGVPHITHRLLFSLEASQTRLSFTTINGIGQIFRFTQPVLTRIIRKGVEVQLKRLKATLEKVG
jgi:predicted ATPase